MKNLIKKEKAITLISLVVTIIILLILAGITISQLTGNGIFNKVKEAKKKYEIAKQDEENRLNEYEDEIENSRDSYNEAQIREIVQDEIKKSLNNITLDYTNKIDIKSYNSASNKYVVPTVGIVTTTSDISVSRIMNTIHINDEWYYTAGGSNGGFVNGAAYSQFVSAGDQIYFVTNGEASYTPVLAYFIPFKYGK